MIDIEVGAIPFNQNNVFYLRWILTNNCFLNCHYCDLHNIEPFYDINSLQSIINFINKKQKQYDIFELRLFGGEPTTHPQFIDIIKRINKCSDFILSTNLQVSLEKLNEIYEQHKVTAYICSWHYNIINNNMFERNLQFLLQKTDIKVKLFLMLEFEYLDDILALQKKYSNISEIKIVRQHKYLITNILNQHIKEINTSVNYNSFIKQYYVKQNNETQYVTWQYLKDNHYDKNYLWKCNAGYNNLVITSNGDVYSCQTYAHHNKQCLGNIINHTYNENNISNTYCLFDTCGCELFIPKQCNKFTTLLRKLF